MKHGNAIKSRWRNAGRPGPLRQFARTLDGEMGERVKKWFGRKR